MKALLVVDIQNDFTTGGSLAVENGDKIIPFVNFLIDKFKKENFLVIATQDWHPKNHESFSIWPVHCVQNSYGAEFHKNLKNPDLIIQKGTDIKIDSYSGFFDNERKKKTNLDEILKSKNITELHIVGIATDYCVKFTVLDALELGYEVFVYKNGVAGVNINPENSEKALEEMKNKGAIII